ncbi:MULTISPECIES: hypothetical protein [unclassified Endozoicomonas]|uniref:hypothetical protein n=1 Tax=unclassified Endozoicomonas TaxID=2644528 RepID=UPI003BB79BE3
MIHTIHFDHNLARMFRIFTRYFDPTLVTADTAIAVMAVVALVATAVMVVGAVMSE